MTCRFYSKQCALCLWCCAAGFALASRLPDAYTGPDYALCAALCAPLRNKKLPLRLAPSRGWRSSPYGCAPGRRGVGYRPAYVVFVCATGRFEPDHSQFSGYYKTASILLIFFSLFLSRRGWTHLRVLHAVYVLFLLVGLMLLRMLRMSKDARRERTFICLTPPCSPSFAAAASSVPARFAGRRRSH